MATDRQIAANRRNSALSTGPTTDEGKSRSRSNAVTHGMTAELIDEGSPEFRDRRAKWETEYQPVGDVQSWTLDKAVAASMRVDQCQRAMERITQVERQRAALAWDQDRAVEAATLLGRLARDPVLASRQLETTRAGVGLLIDAWRALASPLQADRDWSDAQASRALDLLGVSPEARSGESPIHPPEGVVAVAFRRAIVLDEVGRLEALRDEVMTALDDLNRQVAMTGDVAILSKPARLVIRYERDAFKRHDEAVRVLRAPRPDPVVPEPPTPPPMPPMPPMPPVAEEPPAVEAKDESIRKARRSLREQVAQVLANYPEVIARVQAEADGDEFCDAFERRLDALDRVEAAKRSQFGHVVVADAQ